MDAYTAKTIVEVLDIKRDLLQQWIRYGYVSPSVFKASGTGQQNLWSFEDLIFLSAFKDLINAGLSRTVASSMINPTSLYNIHQGKVSQWSTRSFEGRNQLTPLDRWYFLVLLKKSEDTISLFIEDEDKGDPLVDINLVVHHVGFKWESIDIFDITAKSYELGERLGIDWTQR